MTSNIFVISDTHFGHENILNFTDELGNKIRSFHDVHHMNELMIESWNKTVKEQDIVYHLGDVYFGKGHEILSRLKGRKRLIVGNHDNPKSEHILKYFQKVMVWRMFPEFGFVLSHIPLHNSTFEYKNLRNVHGHIHQNLIDDERYINVCVEKINYTPVSIEELK